MAEMMLFNNADTIQNGYAKGLAGLAFNSQGAKRQSALGQLAGLNPVVAQAMKKELDEQDYLGIVKGSKLLMSLKSNPALAAQAYQRMKPQYAALGMQLPDQLDDSVWQSAEQIVNAYEGNDAGDTRWIQTVDANNKPVWAAANNRGITPTTHAIPDSYKFETNPYDGSQWRYGAKSGERSIVGDNGIDPMKLVSDEIEQGIKILQANGVPPEKINAWAEERFQQGQQAVGGREVGGYVGMSAAEKARAEANAKNASELAYANPIAQAKFDAERANAPAIAGATESAKIEAENKAKLKASAPKAIESANFTIALLDKAINHPGRKAATGGTAILPWEMYAGSPAKDFLTLQKQLEGRAFLEAFESLKGGGQITQIEGEKATQAMARLERAQSEGEYLAAINELKDIAIKARERARAAMGGKPQAPASSAGTIERTYNPKTGKIE